MNLELSNSSCSVVSRNPTDSRLAQLWKGWLATQRLRIQVKQERRDLAGLPPYLLKDIGIDPQSAHTESMRAFSDLPENRLR